MQHKDLKETKESKETKNSTNQFKHVLLVDVDDTMLVKENPTAPNKINENLLQALSEYTTIDWEPYLFTCMSMQAITTAFTNKLNGIPDITREDIRNAFANYKLTKPPVVIPPDPGQENGPGKVYEECIAPLYKMVNELDLSSKDKVAKYAEELEEKKKLFDQYDNNAVINSFRKTCTPLLTAQFVSDEKTKDDVNSIMTEIEKELLIIKSTLNFEKNFNGPSTILDDQNIKDSLSAIHNSKLAQLKDLKQAGDLPTTDVILMSTPNKKEKDEKDKKFINSDKCRLYLYKDMDKDKNYEYSYYLDGEKYILEEEKKISLKSLHTASFNSKPTKLVECKDEKIVYSVLATASKKGLSYSTCTTDYEQIQLNKIKNMYLIIYSYLLGCDLFLMSPPTTSGNYKKSNPNHLYLYKRDNGEIFYIMGNENKEHNVSVTNELKSKLIFNQPETDPIKSNKPDVNTAILTITSERGHTPLLKKNEEIFAKFNDNQKHIITGNFVKLLDHQKEYLSNKGQMGDYMMEHCKKQSSASVIFFDDRQDFRSNVIRANRGDITGRIALSAIATSPKGDSVEYYRKKLESHFCKLTLQSYHTLCKRLRPVLSKGATAKIQGAIDYLFMQENFSADNLTQLQSFINKSLVPEQTVHPMLAALNKFVLATTKAHRLADLTGLLAEINDCLSQPSKDKTDKIVNAALENSKVLAEGSPLELLAEFANTSSAIAKANKATISTNSSFFATTQNSQSNTMSSSTSSSAPSNKKT